MSTSEKSFNQVKSILGKLDRNIDQARSRRMHGTAPTPMQSPAAVAAAAAAAPALAPTANGRPGIGRAQPLPRAEPRFGA